MKIILGRVGFNPGHPLFAYVLLDKEVRKDRGRCGLVYCSHVESLYRLIGFVRTNSIWTRRLGLSSHGPYRLVRNTYMNYVAQFYLRICRPDLIILLPSLDF